MQHMQYNICIAYFTIQCNITQKCSADLKLFGVAQSRFFCSNCSSKFD